MKNKKENYILYSLIGIILLIIVIFTLQSNNNQETFRGSILNQNSQQEEGPQANEVDLTTNITALEGESENLILEVSITNQGKEAILESSALEYRIKVQDIEVLFNRDEFTSLEPGDEFTFEYPVPRTIYQYPDRGVVSIEIDPNNLITEINENNNTAEIDYSI